MEKFLKASDIAPPQVLTLNPKTADTVAAWQKIYIDRPSFTRLPGGSREIQYVPWQPQAGDVAQGKFYKDVSGRAIMMAVGNWWIRIPGTDTSTVVTVTILDGSSDAQLQSEIGDGESVANIPGAGDSVTALAAAGGATLLAAGTVRGALSNPTGGVEVWLVFGADTPVVGEGVMLAPGAVIQLDDDDGVILGVKGIADGGDQVLGRQVWT